MADPSLDIAMPVATILPKSPSDDFMTPEQWEVFYALLDGALPGIIPQSKAGRDDRHIALPDEEYERVLEQASKGVPDGRSREELESFFESRLAAEPGLKDDALRMLARSPAKSKLAGLMGMLNTHLGSLVFTGYWSPVTQQSTATRHAIIKSWSQSRLALFRTLSTTVTNLAMKGAVMTNDSFLKLTGYTDVPRSWTAVEGYPFDFIQPGPGDESFVIDTDVVVVGSGPGGGVTAKNLAEAGHRVLVVDKGYYFSPSQLPLTQAVGTHHLFDYGGCLLNEVATMNVLTGSTWGGGGTVNWSVCLRTQDYVRKEWSDAGLTMFGSKKYDECLDRVWDFVGAGHEAVRHNHRNKVILEGSKKLGWKAHPVAQNTANKEHYCGRCHLGCGAGEKRGPATSWLPDAGEAGAEFMEGFEAKRIIWGGEDGKTAVGVEGEWLSRGPGGDVSAEEDVRTRRTVRINAKRVVVSAGTIRSPLLLAASGVDNPHVGRNLHLHPANIVSAIFDEQTNGWEGGIITACNSEFENLDGEGHGVKLETACMVPYTCLSQYPWFDGVESKLLMTKFSRMGSFICITRDRDTGRVYADPETGMPRTEYSISTFDKSHALEGIIALAKLCYVSNATEIQPYVAGVNPFIPDREAQALFSEQLQRGEVKDPEFSDAQLKKWIEIMRATVMGDTQPMKPVACAHQMGSCRMSADETGGVVDGKGKVWGREGLFVADGSVLPSASGVNPMITIMATADWISRGIAEGLDG